MRVAIVGGTGDLTAISTMTDRITGKHVERMRAIGLSQ